MNREDNICARQWLAGHPLAGTASPSNWLRYRVTPLPHGLPAGGCAAPPLRGQRVRDAGALPSLGLARGGRAHRGSSREKTEPARPLVVPLAPRGPVCRRGILSGLHDEGRAAVRVAMGLQSSPLGHTRGASTARTIVPKQAKRAGHAGTRPLAYLGAPPPVFCAGTGEQKAPPDRWAPSLALWRPMSWSPSAGGGVRWRRGRPCGLDRAHSTQGPESDFSLENGAQEGKALQNVLPFVLPCSESKCPLLVAKSSIFDADRSAAA